MATTKLHGFEFTHNGINPMMQTDEELSSPHNKKYYGRNTLTKDGVTYASYQIEHFNSEPRNKNRFTINKNNIHFSSMEEG